MRILGLDFETTGLNPQTDRVIEIGAAVWDTEKGEPIALMSEILKPEGLKTIPPETVAVHGITMDSVETYGINGKEGFERLIHLLDTCQCAVAHNAAFDRGFFEAEVKNYGIDKDMSSVEWVDTMLDVPYPSSIRTRKLSYIAAEHGLLNHHAHRAVTDVLVMMGVLKNYPIEDVILRAASPSVDVIAKVTFDEKDKAKAAGFHWNAKQKQWHKVYKEMDLSSMEFPFETEVVTL